jgi:hypothetical protein
LHGSLEMPHGIVMDGTEMFDQATIFTVESGS